MNRAFPCGLSVLTALFACSSSSPEPDSSIEEEVAGLIGLVVDTRPIFKKGYMPTQVELSFDDYEDRNTTLEVDARTNLAILTMDIDSLTDEELESFREGVSLTLSVVGENPDTGEANVELARILEDGGRVDDSNRPFPVDTDLPYIKRPLSLKEGTPYLLQVEGACSPGVLSRYSVNFDGTLWDGCESCFASLPYQPNDSYFQYALVAVEGKEDTFLIKREGLDDGYLGLRFTTSSGMDALGSSLGPKPIEDAIEFVFEQDEDGWIKIRMTDPPEYVTYQSSENSSGLCDAEDLVRSEISGLPPARFRLISDDIDWEIEDLGTNFSPPILPPPRVQFALKPTPVRNCGSPATVTQTVGVTETKTTTTTVSTSESLELFSSDKVSFDLKVGFEIGAEPFKETVEASESFELTTSETSRTENTWTTTETKEVEVSIEQSVELPPDTAVEVTETLYSIDDVRTPFVQTVRIRGTYKGTSDALSSAEIVSQMFFNFFGGVVTRYGADFVEVTLRGEAVIDQIFSVEVDVKPLPCN